MSVTRYFNLEGKIGWSEILAAVALILSAISLWQSQKAASQNIPAVSVKEDQIVGGPYFNDSLKRWEHLVYARFLITNLGGRATTFLGFEPTSRPPGVIALTGNHGQPAPGLVSKLLIINELPEEIRRSPQRLTEQEGLSMERLRLLNVPIESGATKVIILAVVLDAYDSRSVRRADQFLLAFNLVFSDGYRHKFLGAFPVEAVPGRPPPG